MQYVDFRLRSQREACICAFFKYGLPGTWCWCLVPGTRTLLFGIRHLLPATRPTGCRKLKKPRAHLQNHNSELLFKVTPSVSPHPETLVSVPLHTEHGYSQVHISITTYIYVYISNSHTLDSPNSSLAVGVLAVLARGRSFPSLKRPRVCHSIFVCRLWTC